MRIINQYYDIITPLYRNEILQTLESIGRTCYKSEDRITPTSAEQFVERIISNGHHSVLEHVNLSVRFVTDRGVTHELVRHRLCAFSQESTRYCDYKGEVTFIRPVWCEPSIVGIYDEEKIYAEFDDTTYEFVRGLSQAARRYQELRELGWIPEKARVVLPNALRTEIVCTTNIREWRHILSLRCSNKAHPQIRALMRDLLSELQEELPILFSDIEGGADE